MKYYDIKKLEQNQEIMKDLFYDVVEEVSTNQSYYARLAGFSRQYVHQLIKSDYESATKHIDAKRLIHLYKCIYLDQSGVKR